MFVPTVDIPEPFVSALRGGDCLRACDAPAEGPSALFGRALVRMAVGREAQARDDLEQAQPALGDACRLELAFLDVRQRSAVKDALVTARLVAERAAGASRLAGRAWHVVGLAEGKLRHTPPAVDALLRAAELYAGLDERLGVAQVHDTLGMVEAARGRLDHAMHFFALSLVDKTLLGDRAGMAITLGNLGRVHLRAGRFRDAIHCFRRDLALAEQLHDLRGQARMHEDLGRAYLGMQDFELAERSLRACLALAREHGFADMLFFARKDLALASVAQARLAQARRELDAAEQALPDAAEPYFRLVLTAARGELLLARQDAAAVDVLREAVRGFEQAELPDLEIPARIALARALVQQRYKALAEQCLLRGLRLARADGYARYLPALNEAMASLELVEGAIEESHRSIDPSPARSGGGYVVRQRLGEGAFGEVFRAYDPQRGCDVALKRLKLDELYDLETRRRILASARVELEAASRVRHPGVVRVLAIGTDENGGSYIVQEHVPGNPLRTRMPPEPSARLSEVLALLEQISHALAALHESGVVHRDLKPENILLRDDGRAVLVDFGIAHIMHSRRVPDDQPVGTLAYMAPEQALGRRITPRADLYALGVIAYEWLAGTLPLRPRGTDLDAMARDIATRPPPPLSDFRPDIPAPAERLIMSMLAKKPRRRPAGAMDLAARCRELAVPGQP